MIVAKTRYKQSVAPWKFASALMTCVVVTGCNEIRSLSSVRAYTWQSESMENTIYKGETFLCDLKAYRTKEPAKGDVVVFHHQDVMLAKRLIGLPGDRVEGRNGVLYVNGIALDEPYALHTGPTIENLDTFGPKVVAPETMFLIGDNRNHSLDSRLAEFGEVSFEDVDCKAVSIVKSAHGRSGQAIR